MRSNFKDLTNMTFGKLKVIRYAYSKNYVRFWECVCDCGNHTFVGTHSLLSKHSQSCGCLREDNRYYTHRLSKKTHLYFVWKEMKHRCNNTNHKSYKNYGARGIKVCDEWQTDFKAFYDYAISLGYKEERLQNGKNKWTIDRINNNGNYEYGNIRVVTNLVQSRNKRNNVRYLYNDEYLTLGELSTKYKIAKSLLMLRIYGRKWSIKKAIETPKLYGGKKNGR